MATKQAAKKAHTVSNGHKQALAQGRQEAQVVRDYLSLVGQPKRRGRKRTTDSVDRDMVRVNEALYNTIDPIRRVELIQRRLDLEAEREELATVADDAFVAEAEESFVAIAASFSDRKGITRSAWREMGVPPAVLRRAGL